MRGNSIGCQSLLNMAAEEYEDWKKARGIE